MRLNFNLQRATPDTIRKIVAIDIRNKTTRNNNASYLARIYDAASYCREVALKCQEHRAVRSLVPRPLFFCFCLVTVKKGSGGSP